MKNDIDCFKDVFRKYFNKKIYDVFCKKLKKYEEEYDLNNPLYVRWGDIEVGEEIKVKFDNIIYELENYKSELYIELSEDRKYLKLLLLYKNNNFEIICKRK